MPLEAANNCWPANLEKLSDAVANSAAFKTMVDAADATAAANSIFGKRLTHARSGHAWTADELAELRHYAQVYSDGYGKNLENNSHYAPHGTVIVFLSRLVPEADLVNPGDGRTGLTDTHDRDWQNIVGTVIDQMLSWLAENAGPYPIPNVDISLDFETPAEMHETQCCWQGCELTFSYGLAA